MADEKKKLKILVVDDEEAVRDFLLRIFTMKGLDVKAVEGGIKAIEIAKKEPFDIFFLDVVMPKVSGLDTLKELKKVAPQGKYVMMTGYAVNDILKEADLEGASAAIKKPFDIQQLTNILQGEFGAKEDAKKKLSILVVDDEEVVLNFFRKLLCDYEVIAVPTGKEALEHIRRKDFDLVFLDITLKDSNGIQLCSKIMEIKPGTQIILITGDPSSESQAEKLNIRGYFWKPFEIDKILKEVNTLKQQKYK